jgi:hypothetical protein
LSGAVTTHDDHTRPSRGSRRLAALLLVGALLAGSCTSDDGSSEAGTPTTSDDGPNAGAVPTLAGGLELPAVEPVRVLTGNGLAYGQPLPSQQAAADAFLENPEVTAVTARRIYSLRDGRLVGEALVLALEGSELFDESVLDAFARGVATSLGEEEQEDADIGGRTAIRAEGATGTTIAYVEGNLLVIVRGEDDHDVGVVVERQLAALAAGIAGAPEPRTPLVPLPVDAAFVTVPTVAFQAIPPPEEEPPPETPTLTGATGVQGRYGVVAGERRTTVWAYTLDPQTYPWAETLDPPLAELAASRAGGAPAEAVEVLGRVVQRSNGAEDAPSARAFRHEGLALLVEGADPAQLDAVVSAWIAALDAR